MMFQATIKNQCRHVNGGSFGRDIQPVKNEVVFNELNNFKNNVDQKEFFKMKI